MLLFARCWRYLKKIKYRKNMINNVSIKNYKSVVDVSLPLGRFNLLIGANGCGKSNILEGIAMGAAASSNKLDYEYFANRGIRVVEPRLMTPAFTEKQDETILVSIRLDGNIVANYPIVYNKNAKPARWECGVKFDEALSKSDSAQDLFQELENRLGSKVTIALDPSSNRWTAVAGNDSLDKFLIYSLEENKLRKADDSNRTYPLGRHGEGLFAYIKELAQKPEGIEIINEIKENLKVIDWFDDMEVPSGQLSMEFNLKLKDSYLADTINAFDQRSTNEGFLYLLFYLTLVISDETPRFFAIENIDTAFNPKLCREVTRRLIELARKHNKQIIATTHNAAVLDGMNLFEDDVRLHVVRRNIDGYTKTNRVTLKDDMTMPLSEAWVKGFIGGLPDNF
jgi:predicted ATPase